MSLCKAHIKIPHHGEYRYAFPRRSFWGLAFEFSFFEWKIKLNYENVVTPHGTKYFRRFVVFCTCREMSVNLLRRGRILSRRAEKREKYGNIFFQDEDVMLFFKHDTVTKYSDAFDLHQSWPQKNDISSKCISHFCKPLTVNVNAWSAGNDN